MSRGFEFGATCHCWDECWRGVVWFKGVCLSEGGEDDVHFTFLPSRFAVFLFFERDCLRHFFLFLKLFGILCVSVKMFFD